MKSGKKVKAKMSPDIGTSSGGLLGKELKTEITPSNGYAVGTKNIPALFWKQTSLPSGKRAIVENKENGNE
jgi:hypothetical protein